MLYAVEHFVHKENQDKQVHRSSLYPGRPGGLVMEAKLKVSEGRRHSSVVAHVPNMGESLVPSQHSKEERRVRCLWEDNLLDIPKSDSIWEM